MSMDFDKDGKTLYKRESWGQYTYGIRLQIIGDANLLEETKSKINNTLEEIADLLLCDWEQRSPEGKHDREEVTRRLLECFPAPIYAEEVVNGYHRFGSPFAVNDPWFVVTTTVGHIKIGWRKHVIQIDWSQTLVKATALELFPNEDVTKDRHMIHAWSYNKAKEYISKILATHYASNQPLAK